MRRTALTTLLLVPLIGMTMLASAQDTPTGPQKVLTDFQDPEDMKSIGGGDSGSVDITIAPRAVTDSNQLLKVVYQDGSYPGFHLLSIPKDWSQYEVMRFIVWSSSPYKLSIRIDDGKSVDYKSRFNKTVPLRAGRNLVQLTTDEIGRVLNIKDIRRFILFTANPPKGLTMWFDDFTLGPKIAEKVPFIPYEDRKDLQPSLDVVTPHSPFGQNLAGGPLRAFLLTGIRYGREVPELMQRIDLDPSVQTWDRAWDQNTWGMGDFYGQRGHAFDRVLMQRYFSSTLQGPEEFEVMVLPTPVGWKEFPPAARAALRKRVEEGMGLVLIQPFPGEDPWPEELRELSALVDCTSDYIDPSNGYVRSNPSSREVAKAWKASGDHPITHGVPLEALPFESMPYVKYKLAAGAKAIVVSETGDPIVAVKTLGKGRVVTCGWVGEAITPALNRPSGAPPLKPYRYWEVLYSLIGRSALWAAGRDFQRPGDPEPLRVGPEHRDGNLAVVQWKDSEGKVTDWEIRFTPPGADGITRFDLDTPDHVLRGDEIDVTWDLPEGLDGVTWSLHLGERCRGVWRTLETLTPSGSEASLPTGRMREILGLVRLEGKRDDTLVATAEAEVVVTPPGDAWDDYEVFMWPVGGLPFLRGIEDVLMIRSGSTGVMDTRWGDANRRLRWSRAGLRILPHNLDVRPLHIRPYEFAEIARKYRETGDKKYLIRPASYADPEFLDGARQRMRNAAKELKPFFIPAYVLCDEPSLTSYREDFDFDFHPANIGKFRTSLEAQFGSVQAMNAALGTDFDSFQAIGPPTTAEAKEAGNWGLWNAWRAHNDTIMAEGYGMYRDALREVDPAARISVSGTQYATPFDGFDWGKLSPYFDAMNGYSGAEQERKRLSFYPGPGQMKNAKPAGYGRTGQGVRYQVWNALTDHGCGHVMFWWVSFRNPDLTFCQSAKDYQKVFAEMTGGIGRQYQLGLRHTSPVAIQYSMNSLRAAWMKGQFGQFQAKQVGITQDLVAAGFDPVFLSDEQIANGELLKRGIKAVFLPMGLSLGTGEKQGGMDMDDALRAFLDKGGLVVATDPPTHDEFLQPAKPKVALWRDVTAYDDIKDDLASALGDVDATPWVRVVGADGAVPGLSNTVHKLSGDVDAYIITLLRKPLGQKEVVGADGVITFVDDPTGGRPVEACRVDLSALGGGMAAVAMRTGRALSMNRSAVDVEMPSGDGYAISLLPYSITDIDVDANIRSEDNTLVVSWTLQRHDNEQAFAPHVVRVDVGTLEDEADSALSGNATCDAKGSGTMEIPLAAEDAGRSLKVVVRDILTGRESEAMVSVPN